MKRVAKKCKNRECKQPFNAINGVNLIKDKKGILKVICPWCKYPNQLNKKEHNIFFP